MKILIPRDLFLRNWFISRKLTNLRNHWAFGELPNGSTLMCIKLQNVPGNLFSIEQSCSAVLIHNGSSFGRFISMTLLQRDGTKAYEKLSQRIICASSDLQVSQELSNSIRNLALFKAHSIKISYSLQAQIWLFRAYWLIHIDMSLKETEAVFAYSSSNRKTVLKKCEHRKYWSFSLHAIHAYS